MCANASDPSVPAPLLDAISTPGGGRVVFVLGAGSSVGAPTQLPLAGALSRECHRRLVQDGLIDEGSVGDPSDLSALADAVFAATDSQRELVERFPPGRFRLAAPNDGHRVAAALMIEGAVSNIISLNFDMAQETALSSMGAPDDIATISGPEEHHRVAARNLIYLHRAITADPDQLILRTPALEEAWQGQWEDVMAARVLGGSMTVFIGLGSPAAVLVESTRRIVAAVGGAQMYVVDPGEREASTFFAALGLDESLYLQSGWCDLMRRLGDRVAAEHRAEIEAVCDQMIKDNEWPDEDIAGACSELAELGLLGLGCLRARWLLRADEYAPRSPDEEVRRLLADLVIGVAMLARLSGRRPRFDASGLVEFEIDDRRAAVLVASGGGSRRWAAVEAHVRARADELRTRRPRAAIIAGVAGPPVELAAPENIAGSGDRDSLVSGDERLIVVSVDELRATPDAVAGVFA